MIRAGVLVFLAAAQALPPARHSTCFRFYSLEGDVKPEVLNKAVRALAAGDVEAKIVLGPTKVSSRPKEQFLALELPSKTPSKTVEAALKKVSARAEELAWTAFQGPERSLPAILSYSPLECVVGMDNDLRWFDLAGGRARFFYAPGKLDAEKLRGKFKTLYQPFQAGELGEVVHDALEWKLAGPVDAAAAEAARKAIAKIPGVQKIRIDVESRTLAAEIDHAGLRSATAGPTDPTRTLAATGFLQDEILDALETAKLALEH
jgi:copper chaperone CopZ